MKLLWRILTKNTNTWTKIVEEKYLKGKSILDCTRAPSNSWQMNRLLSLVEEFRSGLKWQLGNGDNINFWKDNWVGRFNLSIYNAQNLDNKVSDFITPSKEWNVPKLMTVVPYDIVQRIFSIRIPRYNEASDELVWFENASGNFSAKTAYHVFRKKYEKVDYTQLPCWKLKLPRSEERRVGKECRL